MNKTATEAAPLTIKGLKDMLSLAKHELKEWEKFVKHIKQEIKRRKL